MKKSINPLRSKFVRIAVVNDKGDSVQYEVKYQKPFNSYNLKDLIADCISELPQSTEKYSIYLEYSK